MERLPKIILVASSSFLTALILFLVIFFIRFPAQTSPFRGYMILDSEDDFEQFTIPGNGSENNPYIIENLHFTSENLEDHGTLLLIESISSHIIIRNCSFTGGYLSIVLTNISQGSVLIQNNTFISSLFCQKGICIQTQYAIKIIGSENIIVKNNSFSGIDGNIFIYGVSVEDSSFVIVMNNLFNKTYYGFFGIISQNVSIEGNSYLNNSDFYLRECSYYNLFNNYFTDIDQIGIHCCAYFDIANNSFYNNINNNGLDIHYCENMTFFDNQLINGTYGIVFRATSYSLIQSNYFENILFEAVQIPWGGDNLIFHNSFYNNNQFEFSNGIQAFDEGVKNLWYNPMLLEGNFWSNLGLNSTYTINGSIGSVDLYPLSEPII